MHLLQPSPHMEEGHMYRHENLGIGDITTQKHFEIKNTEKDSHQYEKGEK